MWIVVIGGEAGEEEVGGCEDLSPFHNHWAELGFYDTSMGGIDQMYPVSISGYQWLCFYLRTCTSGGIFRCMLHALSNNQHRYAGASP